MNSKEKNAIKLKKYIDDISKYWEEKEYIKICKLANKALDAAQSYLIAYNTRDFLVNKMSAYIVVASVIMCDNDNIRLIEEKKNMKCISDIFADDEICKWIIETLNIINIDYVRNSLIERVVPKRFADRFDFNKFDANTEKQNEAELKKIAERREDEWQRFLEKCEHTGVLDLKSVTLNFPKEYFDGETRNGFYIAPFMKNSWAASLEILHKVDILCQTLDIPYFADWGTLLGTIRHHGFIPWDDDIDIGVLRKDYDKLKYAIANCQNELQLYDVYNDAGWGGHASRITNTLSFSCDRDLIKRYHGFSFPAGIDVFVIDCVPRDKKQENEQYDALKIIAEIVTARADSQNCKKNSDEYYFAQKNEKILLETLQRLCHVTFTNEVPDDQELYVLKEEILSVYSEEQSDYYTVPHRLANGQDYYIPKDVFDGRIRMPFENIEVSVPKGYDFILRKNYGDDYMTPINRGGGHNYPYYDIFVEAMQEERGDKTIDDTWRYIENVSYGYYKRFLNQKANPVCKFDNSYFKPDTIDGFKINEMTKRNHAAELEVLAEIKRICNKKKLRYFAIGDTITGAVRLAGYLPQSEGIHLGMLRDDYVEFMNCLSMELDSWFTYQSIYSNDEHMDMRTYIITDAYMVRDDDYMERFHGSTDIVGIDISPIDYVEDDVQKEQVRLDLIKALLKTSSVISDMPPYTAEELSLVDEWKDKVQIDISKESNVKHSFIRAADTVASGERNKTKMVRITPDLQIGINNRYRTDWFEDGIELPFENTTIIVPKGYKNMIGE